MTVASVTEISAVSERSFEDAIRTAVDCATETLRGVEGWWVKDQNVTIEDGSITGYRVNLEVTFLLEEAAQGSPTARPARRRRRVEPCRSRNGRKRGHLNPLPTSTALLPLGASSFSGRPWPTRGRPRSRAGGAGTNLGDRRSRTWLARGTRRVCRV